MTDPEVAELVLYAENDADLWMRRRKDYMKNALRKMNAGKYELSKAVKLWRGYADEAAKKYAREFPGARFSPAVRNQAAAQFARDFEAEVRAGEHETLRESLMTKAQRKANKGPKSGSKSKTIVFM